MENLGDKIAFVAQPIARGIDAVFNTNVARCRGCNQMQANLNSGMSLTDAIYQRWFNAEQEGEKMNEYQITLVVKSDTMTEAVTKAESIGDILAAQLRIPAQLQPKK